MDKYKVTELIGEGSFGRVYKGYHKENQGHWLALKLVPKVGQSEADLAALRRECQIQKNVNHDNIVKAVEAFETINQLVLVTNFVEGGNLALLMSQFPQGMPEEKVHNLTVDLLCALHYLHSRRILHRDLKPQNVLIEKASGKAILTDFGFARNLGNSTFVLTSIKGTPLYMAPELIEEKPYDFKADLWSAGGILYEAAFGQPPFATNNLFQLIKKIRYESVFWPSDHAPSIGLLKGLLEKDPKKRLEWNEILQHEYLTSNPRIQECQKTNFEFTKTLTESQELAKEIQRQDKAKKLPQGSSHTLINIAQKYEEQKAKGRRYSDFPAYQGLLRPSPVRRNSDVAFHEVQSEQDETFNNEEWMQFLDSQLSEGVSNVNTNDLNLLIKPLKTSKASVEVMVKTVAVLALPFLDSSEKEHKEIIEVYKKSNVIESVLNCLNCVDLSEIHCIKTLLMLLARLCYYTEEKMASNMDPHLFVSILATIQDDAVQKYCLDILIAIAIQDPNAVMNLKSDQIFKCVEKFPKKALLLLTLIPSKKQDLKLWLRNNKLPDEHCQDESLLMLCDKINSL